MIPLLLLGGLLLGATAVAITFWEQIKKFLGLALEKVKKIVKATIIGAATYIQSNNWREGIRTAYAFYSKNEQGQWQETVTTKTISPNEVPAHILKKLENTTDTIDISEELELELK